MSAHRITTFYSYKGGVGRSMAVANIAATLALRGETVLVIDFDLEAPGLHRYFPRSRQTRSGGTEISESGLGVIDLFEELRHRLLERFSTESSYDPSLPETLDACREIVNELVDKYTGHTVSLFPNLKTSIQFLPAGRFDDQYQERIRRFDWVALFETFGEVFQLLREAWIKRYQHILVDSRTGLTDIGSITTMILPDRLVVVFSPNEQSLHGGIEIARQAIEMSGQRSSEPFMVFPLLSRVDKDDSAQRYTWSIDVGRRWSALFQSVYGWTDMDLLRYFEDIYIPHSSYYAYGEHIAVDEMLERRGHDTIAGKYASFVRVLDRESLAEWVANTRPELEKPQDCAWLVGIDAEIKLPEQFATGNKVKFPPEFRPEMRQLLRSPGHAMEWLDIARVLDQAAKDLIRNLRGHLHVYVMAPYAAAILIGRLLNEYGRMAPIHLYQFSQDWRRFSSPFSAHMSVVDEPWFQHPETTETKFHRGPIVLAIEGAQRLAPSTLDELAEQIQASGVIRLRPRNSTPLFTFSQAQQALSTIRRTLEDIHGKYPHAAIHLVTSAPVAMMVELGRMLSSTVYGSVVIHQYESQAGRYFPVLDVMKPFEPLSAVGKKATSQRKTSKKKS